MRWFLLPLLGLVILSTSAPAGNAAGFHSSEGRLAGVVSNPDGQPLPGVRVSVRSARDSTLVTGTLTDGNGGFRIDGLPLDRYVLHVAIIGFRPRMSEVIELTEEAPEVDLGEIALEAAPIQLAGIEATAERAPMVVRSDRTVYNTATMPVAASGSAIDVLRSVPELEVDMENNVRLRGNRPVAIHMNGRPTPMEGEELANFLEQLPGDRIERIEVMPNPSARHDPEGAGGIVNIVLRKDVELGLSGSLSANASTRNRQSLSGRFNVQHGRFTLFSGGGANLNGYDWLSHDWRRNLAASPITEMERDRSWQVRQGGWNLDWTAELRVGEQATLWSEARINRMHHGADGVTEYGVRLDEANGWEEQYHHRDDFGVDWNTTTFDAGFKQVFEAQHHELTIDGRVSSGADDQDTEQKRVVHVFAGRPVDRPVELTLNDVDAGNRDLSVQADYVRPIGDARLELGLQSRRREQDNDNLLRTFATAGETDPADSQHSGYDYQETFHSLYATYGRTAGKLSFEAGLRAERSITRFAAPLAGTRFERTYDTFFPSLSLSYRLNPGRTLRFLYSKRIRRPSAYFLDPDVPSTDPLNRTVGNPDLKPSLTQSFSMDFSWTGRLGTLRVAPYYRYTSDIWANIRTADADGVATSRWENGASARAYGSHFTVSLAPGRRFGGSTNFSVYRDVRDGTNLSADYRGAALLWSLGGNLDIKVNETLTAQVTANHYPAQSVLQGSDSGYTWTTLALRQDVWDGRGTVSLNVRDPLKLSRFDSWSRDATHVQESRSTFTDRVMTLGFSYNFGSQPERQGRQRQGDGEGQVGATIPVP